MSLEKPEEIPLRSEIQLLSRQIDKEGIDTANNEDVVKLAHLLFGTGYPEHEVEAIIEAFYQEERVVEAEADSKEE